LILEDESKRDLLPVALFSLHVLTLTHLKVLLLISFQNEIVMTVLFQANAPQEIRLEDMSQQNIFLSFFIETVNWSPSVTSQGSSLETPSSDKKEIIPVGVKVYFGIYLCRMTPHRYFFRQAHVE
jgi:hypothetical protein